MSEEVKSSGPVVAPPTKIDYIVFGVSLVAIIYLLIFHNEWFWLALPSLLASLVKILRVI